MCWEQVGYRLNHNTCLAKWGLEGQIQTVKIGDEELRVRDQGVTVEGTTFAVTEVEVREFQS